MLMEKNSEKEAETTEDTIPMLLPLLHLQGLEVQPIPSPA